MTVHLSLPLATRFVSVGVKQVIRYRFSVSFESGAKVHSRNDLSVSPNDQVEVDLKAKVSNNIER